MSTVALAAAPPAEDTRQFRTTVALCWLGWVFDFYDLILIAFLMPAIEKSLHINALSEQGGWLLGIGLGASGLGGILFGWLADGIGRKKTLTITVILFSVGMLLTGFVQTFEQFLLARFITGLGLGGEWAVGHALIAESVPAETRGRWSAFLQSGEPIGVALAAVIGFTVAPIIGWRAVFWTSALSGLLALCFRKLMKESPIWLKTPPVPARERMARLRPFLAASWGIMLLAWVLAVLKLGTYWTCYNWLPRFIEQTFGQAIHKSVLWILVGQVGQFIGMMTFGGIADQLGRRWAFTLFSLLTVSALVPLALMWNELFLHQQPFFWALMFLLGIGSGCTSGFGALLSELFPTAQRTFAMGTVYNMGRMVQIFAPQVMLWAQSLSAKDSHAQALLVPATLALLTALWVWLLPDRRGLSLEVAAGRGD